MSNVSVEEKVKAIVVKNLGVDEASVVGGAKFTDDLGADSLDIVELVMEMEEAFGISVPEDETENLRTVDDVVNFVKKSLPN